MKINSIKTKKLHITEIIADEVILKNEQDALTLMSEDLSDHVILYEHNIDRNFFDLSTRIAGEILQKFINYHISVAIVGDFNKYPSNTLKDFIYENNKIKDHLFVKTKEEAIKLWEE